MRGRLFCQEVFTYRPIAARKSPKSARRGKLALVHWMEPVKAPIIGMVHVKVGPLTSASKNVVWAEILSVRTTFAAAFVASGLLT
jgi:hypothetical protein